MKNDFVKRTLDNGLVVYFYADKKLKRVVASYNVKYGYLGYYDKFYYDGKLYEVPNAVAHYLEHVLIEYSKYGNMMHRFNSRSYNSNGGTRPELTSFYFIGIKDTKQSIKELIEFVDDPVFTRDDVDDARSAIIDETRACQDRKYSIIAGLHRNNVFNNFQSLYENGCILGSKETTESITYEDLKICYDAYYSTDNKFLVIGGNIDVDEYVEYLNSIVKELPEHPNRREEADYGDFFPVRCEYDELEMPINQDYFIRTYKFREEFDIPKIMVDLYIHIMMTLKFSSDRDFVTNAVRDGVIVGGIGWSLDFFKGTISLTMSADVLDKDEFIKRLERELKVVPDDKNRFELLKKNYIADELNKIDFIYNPILRFSTEVDFTENIFILDMLEKLNFEEMVELFKKLDFDTFTTTYVKKTN